MKKKFIVLIIFFLIFNNYSQLFAQSRHKTTAKEYIEKYKDIAIKEMKKHNIPASITIAQGMLESGLGQSKLATKANNHFGIKCHKDWNGKTFRKNDDKRRECFRKYNSVEESFSDHSIFLSQRNRYKFLFNYEISDYKSWARGLRKAGYSTNSRYPKLLIAIIEEHELHKFDSKRHKNTKSKKQKSKYLSNSNFSKETKFEFVSINSNNRKIYKNNNVKLIIAEQSDTYKKIADEFNIYTYQLYKYNDLKKTKKITPGQIIYVQSKKKKCDIKSHQVKQNETMYTISQFYGIKLNKLYAHNNMIYGEKIKEGQILLLDKQNR
ncbi:MAG: glucosaminidase domain-containing protein [Bacteroidales bacterium]|nr:glucosaminidase domain-containing protein [Bacteroidales bacterium]